MDNPVQDIEMIIQQKVTALESALELKIKLWDLEEIARFAISRALEIQPDQKKKASYQAALAALE